MSKYTESDRVIALAGVFQAAKLTWEIARQGSLDNEAMGSSLYSLFQTDPKNINAVFGGTGGVTSGLRCLLTQLDSPAKRNVEITRYSLALLQLERKLTKDRKRLDLLGQDIVALKQRVEDFSLSENTRFSQLADIYQTHISKLSPRIMVKGEPLHLQNPDNASRIRTALLAGIRAAVLWSQCGGRRWQLILRRRQIVSIARELLHSNA